MSLTPLIDVVFILIMFFMLTTQFEHKQVLQISVQNVNASPSEVSTDSDIARLLVLETGVWQFNDNQYSFSDKAAMEELVQFNNVYVSANSGVVLQDVIEFIDELAVAGVSQVSWVPSSNTNTR